ncbi:hypothetical protein JMA19_21165 [Acinetobacter baumannii]|nr:hypothetical protein [Acinetobacter baumannii]
MCKSQVHIVSDWVTVDTGLKSEGIVDRAEFLNEQRELSSRCSFKNSARSTMLSLIPI